ncbi:Ig-like domain-containing protein [Candidatus Poriferisodalis sp.]|uniref:Ig-like domain-containing protein n=1 Tax=Candidatus Poriferisodalis sp. TaxID=3101277 RepID=UPI003B02937D
MRQVNVAGALCDADGNNLATTAASSDEAVATVAVAADQSALTVAGVAGGTATITVTAEDPEGN